MEDTTLLASFGGKGTAPQTITVLQPYSLGIAAINLPLGSKLLEVTPIERTNMANGELSDNTMQSTIKATDSQGVAEEVTTNTTVTLTAEWLPMGSNRFSPPNVRRGEEVLIYKLGDSDKYYWVNHKYNPDLRKLETVIFTVSNTQDEDAISTSENTVFIEVSTHAKVAHLRWNKSDGEPHAWDIQLNAKDSVFQITDDLDNRVLISSLERLIEAINHDGTWMRLDRKNFNAYAPDDMSLECGRNFSLKVGGMMTQNVVGTWNWETDVVTGKYPSATYNNEVTTFSGNVVVKSNTTTGGLTSLDTDGAQGFEVRGNGKFTGSFTVEQSVHIQQDLQVDGNIKANGSVSGSNI